MLDSGRQAPNIGARPTPPKRKLVAKNYTSQLPVAGSPDEHGLFARSGQHHSRSHSDIASIGLSGQHSMSSVSTASSAASPHICLYKSYCRESGIPETPYEAHVRGWLYYPALNRKGKLMIAAVERLVGNPGKYSSIADAAAAHVAEDVKQSSDASSPGKSSPLIDLSDSPDSANKSGAPTNSQSPTTHRQSTSPYSSWLNLARPVMFRSRSSKSVLKAEHSPSSSGNGNAASAAAASRSTPNSAVHSPLQSPSHSNLNSAVNSAVNSAANSAANSAVNSPVQSAANTAPNSPTLDAQHNNTPPNIDSLNLNDNNNNNNSLNVPKRPGMRRTTTFTFDPHSNPNGKVHSASHLLKKEQKHVIRERLAAISHKSLALRDVFILIESEPDAKGHRKKRTFWSATDDTGRFTQCCCVPFKPVSATVMCDATRETIPLVFVPQHGISVISDIDDTVRHTGVTKSKRELLQNVLAKHFDDVRLEGVSEWYNQMKKAGAHFHYVSNSPWQLYDTINGFLQHHKFPEGSIHLKKYAGVFDGLTEPAKGRKRATLERILTDFPHQKFILVGDSGEADLEAYSEVAQKFPSQVLAIYIRDITLSPDEPLSIYERRLQKARRYHSVDLITMEKEGKLDKEIKHAPGSSRPPTMPPNLPPRIRKDHTNPAGAGGSAGSGAGSGAESPKSVDTVGAPSTPSTSSLLDLSPPLVPEVPPRPSDIPPATESVYASPAQSPPPLESQGGGPFSGEPISNITLGLKDESLRQEQGQQQPPRLVESPASAPGSPGPVANTSATEPAPGPGPVPTQAAPPSEKPKLPPRPKLLRRTSSKIMEGLNTMASVSTHAASRLLGPQLPARPGSKLAPSREVSPTPKSDSLHPEPHAPHRTLTGTRLVPHHNTTHPIYDASRYDSHRHASPASPNSNATLKRSPSSVFDAASTSGDTETPAGFISSTQDYTDLEKPDKRSDHWKNRVTKQYRRLPHHVSLRMWRHPRDVESESIRLISGNDDKNSLI